ncbi:MAG: hypothetical protein HQL84_05015 [Magnetococcales bacterium]|nr:hypothetical protein [Magnetococcales bacterium]MBF0149391.1 hypothetical protein [Magnetococcales bacterium]
MRRTFFHLELLDNLICQSSNASVGLPPGLDYIPGNMFLGAVAHKLYSGLQEKAFEVFHSGRVRFGDALPLTPDGQPALPMPLCLHGKKHSTAIKDEHDRLIVSQLHNARVGADEREPWQPLRRGYLTLNGEWLQPKQSITMKTAINSKTGRAFEGHIFGYHGLMAGQRFWTSLEADDTVEAALFEQVVTSLEGRLRLGNSRNAEFGGVHMTRAPDPRHPLFPSGEVVGCRELTLWLVADLMALDPIGMPTLAPLPQWLGLPGGRMVPEKSFLRHRVYAPFNGTRAHEDPERSCIKAGGIIHFELDHPLAANHVSLLDRGLGVHLEAGLGRVIANPPLLLQQPITFYPTPPPFPPVKVVEPTGDHPLIQWMQKRVDGSEQRVEGARLADTMRPWLGSLYQNARRLNGIPDTTPVGPGASQWSGVMTLARMAKDDTTLMEGLFGGKGTGKGREAAGLCSERAGGQGWMNQTSLDGKVTTFRDAFKELCENGQARARRGFVVALARRAMDVAKEQNR